MRKWFAGPILALAMTLVCSAFPSLYAQDATRNATQSTAPKQPFDPRDLGGDWIGENTLQNSRWANDIPEPPLTDWAREHLLYKSISHDAMSGTLKDPNDPPNTKVPESDRAFFAKDLYGVIANDPFGMYPGKNCDPIAAPAMYDTPFLGMYTFFVSPERIVMLSGHHREWRVFWMNKPHVKDMDPTFEGDSVAHWEGDTLVVDTIGYNGRAMVSGTVGHSMSDAFHLVERFHLLDQNTLALDMTFYDPKAWGDKPWPGFHKYFHRVPIERAFLKRYSSDSYAEWICSVEDNVNFEKGVLDFKKK